MNNTRRRVINNAKLELQSAISRIGMVRMEESLALSGIPENLINTPNANKMEDAISYIDEAEQAIYEAIDALNNID